jgi:uncharacterized protein YdeI (YjbR/CyaY-like superfamily)
MAILPLKGPESTKPRFFATPGRFRAWLEKNHERTPVLLVGFHKKDSGRPSITWQEAVDQALCFGWIDGVRRSIDGGSYTIRFTPRKPRSTWSAVNIRRTKELIALGLVHAAGLQAFARRSDEKSAIYSYEQRHNAALDGSEEKQFRAEKAAWAFFEAQAPSYRRTAAYWVVSAKRPETRARRLATLIGDCAAGRRIAPLARAPRTPSAS